MTMKLKSIALAAALALSSTLALAAKQQYGGWELSGRRSGGK
jgi:hypothetical protein